MAYISEVGVILNAKRMSTVVLRYPSGRYGIAGSIPVELTVEATHIGRSPGARKSMAWNTEAEAISALLEVGVTRFQLNDCSWYQAVEQS